MNTETENESYILPRKRHINFGDYENEEFRAALPTELTVEGNLETHRKLMQLLNEIEIDARRNRIEMNLKWQKEQDQIRDEQRKKQDDLKEARKSLILDFVKINPNATPWDIAVELDITEYDLRELIDELVQENRLARRDCRRQFDIVSEETAGAVVEE